MIPDRMAIDRALELLPQGMQRDQVADALTDDGFENGRWPKYRDIRTVEDVRRLGVNGLSDRCGLSLDAAGWLMRELGCPPEPAGNKIAPTNGGISFADPVSNHIVGNDIAAQAIAQPLAEPVQELVAKPAPKRRGWPKGVKRGPRKPKET